MSSRLTGLVLALTAGCALAACDPADPCDPGFYADHGACYAIDAGSASQTDSDEDAGSADAAMAGSDAYFGKACESAADCGGVAPACGAPTLPVCTMVNCMSDGHDQCPSGWSCLDVSNVSPDKSVTSVCVNF